MRKATVVLVLTISSVLLLQAPAWAPKLYSVNQVPGRTALPSIGDRFSATVEAETDCGNQLVRLTFAWGEQTPAVRAVNGVFRVGVTRIPKERLPVGNEDVTGLTCDGTPGELAFTGTSTTRLLVLGVVLVAGGALLVAWSRRDPRVVTRPE